MVAPEKITTTSSLLEALDDRGSDPAVAKAFDEAVWAARGSEGAMLVTDLSGFTRVTKARGILHFLAIFRRCQLACVPLIASHGGKLLKQEADDLIAIYPDASKALTSALAMLESTRVLNRWLAEEDRVYMCMGIEQGSLLALEDDAFGDPVNVAFKLGEELAEPNEILVGHVAFERLLRDGVDLSRCEVSERRTLVSGSVPIEHHSVRLKEEG